jgi:AraC-like DNA-binding protein
MILPALQLNDPCGRAACAPGWTRTRENSLRLTDMELWFVWRGQGWMRTRKMEMPLYPGFCCLMRPGGIYDAGHDDAHPIGITFIHFSTAKGRALPCRDWPEFYDLDDLDFYNASTRRIIRLFHSAPDVAAELLRGLLMDVHRLPPPFSNSATNARAGFHRQRITELMAALSTDAGPLPSVESWAREMHLSPAHFSRVFKSVTGQSPRDFLIGARLSQARHLLSESNLSVGEIADRLDYADLFFFSRQFKQKTGLSPLQYRNRNAH